MQLLTVGMLSVWMTIAVSVMKSNTGRQFLVIFLEMFNDDCKLGLYITTSSVNPVTVDVTVPLRLDLGRLISVELTSTAPGMVDILSQLIAKGNGKSDNGILVGSSGGDITIQAYSQTLPSTGLNSTGSFMVIPVESLGTEYMVLTYCVINFCQFAVASPVDTVVELDLKIAWQASFTYQGVNYKDGDVFKVDLKAFQVFQVRSTGDLSGTIIKSSPGKLAVVVGASHTSVGSVTPGTTEKDYLVEQMPPLNTMGWSYVIVPFPGRTSGDVVVLLAMEKDCLLTGGMVFPVTLKYRKRYDIVIYPGASGSLDCTGRFMIAHITSSPEVSNNNTDASMYFVPPVAQWRSANTTIVAATSVTVMIYGKAGCVGTLVVSGSVLPASKWTPIFGTDYAHTTLDLTNKRAVVESSNAECAELAGYIYGTSWITAFSLSIGSYFRELFPPHIESSSRPRVHMRTTPLLPEVTSSTESTVPSIEASYTTSTSVFSTMSLSPMIFIPQIGIHTEPPLPTQPQLPTVTTQTPQTPPLTQPPTQLPSSSSSSPLSSTLSLKTSAPTSSTTVGTRSLCRCRCPLPDRELKTEVALIKQRLTLDASGLSKTLRRKSSVPDERRSAVAIGTSATVFLVLSVGVVVATDVFAVIVHVVRMFM